MYEEFYGLTERAFAPTPDPRLLLLTPRHLEALDVLRYAVSGRPGLTLLVGGPGSGKTTLLRAAIEEAREGGARAVLVDNPVLSRHELFELLAGELGLGSEAAHSKARFLLDLRRTLGERGAGGGRSVLVVDEAQDLTDELLEEIRLLANLGNGKGPLLPIVLSGHPELAARLDAPDMTPLRQRIELRTGLEPLSLVETADYIAGRLRLCGGDVARTFTRDAVEAVFAASGGLPRPIGVICEGALVTGFALAARPIDRDIVAEVCRDLDLPLPGAPLPPDDGDDRPLGTPAPEPPPDPAPASASAGHDAPEPRAPEPAVTAAGRGPTGERRAEAESAPALPTGTRHDSAVETEAAELLRTGGSDGGPAATGRGRGRRWPRLTRPELGRRMLALFPFARAPRGGPTPLEVRYFDASSEGGFVVTPAVRPTR